MKHDLAGVGVFSFVALERHRPKMEPDAGYEQHRQPHNDPAQVAAREVRARRVGSVSPQLL